MIPKILPLAAIAIALAASACAPTTLYEWGSYEPALYSYTQNPANRDAYKLALVKAIERGRARHAVAPGLLAELGYLYMADGDATEALKCFQEERSLFPESAMFMERVINQLGSTASSTTGKSDAVS